MQPDLSTYEVVVQQCWAATQDLHIAADEQSRMVLSMLQLAQEHHASLVVLIQHRQYGSAFALLRPLYEAYVRAVWLWRLATEAERLKFQRKDDIPGLSALAKRVGELPDYRDSDIGVIAQKMSALHSYTHNGHLPNSRRQTAEGIEPAYEAGELQEVLDVAQYLGVLSTIAVLEIAESSGQDVQERLDLVHPATSVLVANTQETRSHSHS